MSDMSLFQAVVLGIVEGVTEYLPVSSTGHLLLVQKGMGMGAQGVARDASEAYAVCIQAGAILAVAGLYFKRLKGVVAGAFGRDPAGLQLGINMVSGFIPAAVVGLTLEKWIKATLFGGGRYGLWPIVLAWLAGGIAILLIERRRRATGCRPESGKTLAELTWGMALLIGIVQILAMWPGVSRSLATILGGLWTGLSLTAAVEFSFLLGLITLGAATAMDAIKHGHEILAQYGWEMPLVGLVVSFLSAALAIKWLVGYLQKHPMSIFGYYRIGLACITACWLLR